MAALLGVVYILSVIVLRYAVLSAILVAEGGPLFAPVDAGLLTMSLLMGGLGAPLMYLKIPAKQKIVIGSLFPGLLGTSIWVFNMVVYLPKGEQLITPSSLQIFVLVFLSWFLGGLVGSTSGVYLQDRLSKQTA
jgi:hypothetical protein